MLKPSLVLAFLLLPFAATAQIYQWKDASGKTQYSDQPPPASARQERTITPQLPPAAAAKSGTPATAASRSYQDQDADFKKRRIEEEETKARQNKTQSAAEERKRNCEAAQGNLKNLQVGGRQVRYDPKTGERVFLTEDEISQSIKDAQRAIDDWCKPQTAQR